jgi:hypothetical protein
MSGRGTGVGEGPGRDRLSKPGTGSHWLTTGGWHPTTDFLLLSAAPTFVPIDSRGSSVLVLPYTGKEVV